MLLEIVKENELTLGFIASNPYSDLYCENFITLLPYTSTEIYTGIKEIKSNEKNVIFYILGENMTQENDFVETVSNFYGLNTPIYIKKINHFHLKKEYNKDDFLAYIVAFKCYVGPFQIVDILDETNRSTNGFGSTGYK